MSSIESKPPCPQSPAAPGYVPIKSGDSARCAGSRGGAHGARSDSRDGLSVISLFAGIGGFDLGFTQAGMRVVAHVEKDPHCRKLLAAKWPDSVVLDDVRTAGKHNLPPCDVICGGFPCQDLSVAGKRAGLQGERSGLFYEMARIVSEMRPTFVIFENVPGLLSSCGGNDWDLVVDEFTNLGYVLDANVLDAQFFGVAQRRKRIFGVCTRADHLLKQRTLSSLQTLLQWAQEVLVTILAGARPQYVTGLPESDANAGLCADGLIQRMKLFGITTSEDWNGFAKNLADTLRSCLSDSRNSESASSELQNGGDIAADTNCFGQWTKECEAIVGSMLKLWSELWDERFASQSASTISTALSQTTESKISTCAEISSITCWLIVQSRNFYLNFLDAASSALIVNKVFTNYARHSVSDLFTDPQGLRDHRDYLVRHEGRFRMLPCGHSGTKRAEEVLLVHEGVRGHPAPSRTTGKDVAGTLGASFARGSSKGGGGMRNDLDSCGAFICPEVAGCLQERDAKGADSDTKPWHFIVVKDKRLPAWQRCECCDDVAETSHSTPHSIATGSTVRRLTPRECERLQGFPDDWTAGFADSTRYRMLGNAVAVPVARWIAARICAAVADVARAGEGGGVPHERAKHDSTRAKGHNDPSSPTESA